MNARDDWRGLNVIVGRDTQQLVLMIKISEMNVMICAILLIHYHSQCAKMMLFLCCHMSTRGRPQGQMVLSHVNSRKAPGPDGFVTCQPAEGPRARWFERKGCESMCHSVRECFSFCWILNLFCIYGGYPPLYLLPKKRNAILMKDFALTSVLCKCMERIVHCQLTTAVAGRIDLLQFAYRAGRGWRMPL